MVDGVDGSLRLYVLLLVLVAVQRLAELRLSGRHRRAAMAAGATEYGARHYPFMVGLHSLFLPACALEVWLLERPFIPRLAAAMLVLLVAATALRLWTIRTLGERWTTRVFAWPNRPLVTGGPYRFLRHPNYLAVVTEMAAIPLLHTAWLTALTFSILNAVLLSVRIGVEERALATSPLGPGRSGSGSRSR